MYARTLLIMNKEVNLMQADIFKDNSDLGLKYGELGLRKVVFKQV